MYCNQCGNIVPDGGAFCTFCGAKCEAPVEKQSVSETAIVQTSPTQLSEPVEKITPVAAPAHEAAAPVPEAIPLEPVKKQKKEKQEKYYTRGHIVFCLVVNGILAIAAGVFAGLYFTTVF